MPEIENDEDDVNPGDEGPSKSQKKREMADLRDLGEKLLSIPEDQLSKIPDPDIIDAILACKKITKGNARKRQLQYIGKLLRSAGANEARELIDRFDSSTRAHVKQFHQLEQWRERLIAEDDSAMSEVIDTFPHIDRQHFRHLVRNAVTERKEERDPPVQFRKLFQFLKSLEG